jgi:hypothetical protein
MPQLKITELPLLEDALAADDVLAVDQVATTITKRLRYADLAAQIGAGGGGPAGVIVVSGNFGVDGTTEHGLTIAVVHDAPVTCTVGTVDTAQIGHVVAVVQAGSDAPITFAEGSGVTVDKEPGYELTTYQRNSLVTLLWLTEDYVLVTGSLAETP